MRYLSQDDNSPNIPLSTQEAKEINQELIDLGNAIAAVDSKADANAAALQEYKDETSLTKQTLNANAVYSAEVTADDISTQSIAATSGNISTLESATATITDLEAGDADITNAEITNADVGTLEADNATVNNKLTAAEVETTTLTAANATIANLVIDGATITTFDIDSADIDNDLTVGGKITADEADLKAIVSDEATIDLITSDAAKITQMQAFDIFYNENYVDIEPGYEPTDLYRIVELPYFRTGDYYLTLVNPYSNKVLWSVIAHNNHNNYTVSYSRKSTGDTGEIWTTPALDEMVVYDYNKESPKLYLKTHVGGRLYWQNQSENPAGAPRTYATYPFDISSFGAFAKKCLHNGATWYTKHIDIGRDQSAGGASLFLTPTDWNNATRTSSEFNGEVDIDWHFYVPDQSLNTTDEVTFRNLRINPLEGKWVYNFEYSLMGMDPEVVTNGQLNPAPNLVETEELCKWDGKVGIATPVITSTNGTIYREEGYEQDPLHTNVYLRKPRDEYMYVDWGTKYTVNNIVSVRRKSDGAIITSSPWITGEYIDPDGDSWTSYRFVFYDIDPDGRVYEEWIERNPYTDPEVKLLDSTVDANLYINCTRFKENFDYGVVDFNMPTFGTYSNSITHLGDVVEGRWDAGDIHVQIKNAAIGSSEPNYNGTLTVDGGTLLQDNVLIQDQKDPLDIKNVSNVDVYADNTTLEGDELYINNTEVESTNDRLTVTAENGYLTFGKAASGGDPATGGLNLTTENDSAIQYKGDTSLIIGTDPNSEEDHTGKLTINYSEIELVGHKKDVNDDEIQDESSLLIRDTVHIGTETDKHNLHVHGALFADGVSMSGNLGDNMRIRNTGTVADPVLAAVSEPCAVEESGTLVTADSLVTAETIGSWNGTTNPHETTDPDYNVDDNSYPITEMGDDSTIHGDVHIEATAQIDSNVTIGIPADDPDPAVPADLLVTGDTTINGDVAIDGTLEVGSTSQFNGDVTIGKAAVGADPAVPADLIVNGDIIQNGENFETHLEQVFTSKDHVILREGQVVGLAAGEHAGLEIKNYDGNGTQLHFCVDSTGWGRVGDTDSNGDSQTVTYSYEYNDYGLYKDTDPLSPTYEHYFDDIGLTIEHVFYIPTGAANVTYTDTAETDPGTGDPTGKYTVTFEYELDGNSLQKILTIEDSPSDTSLLYWDAVAKQARTLIKPAGTDLAVVPVFNGDHVEYRKYEGGGGTGNGSVFVGTAAEIAAAIAIPEGSPGYLPQGAIIIQTDADDTYLHGEDITLP